MDSDLGLQPPRVGVPMVDLVHRDSLVLMGRSRAFAETPDSGYPPGTIRVGKSKDLAGFRQIWSHRAIGLVDLQSLDQDKREMRTRR